MTPIEKAQTALNTRIDRLQAGLREAGSEPARQFQLQSLVACIGIGEALMDYVRMIGQFAKGRHAELQQANAPLIEQHAGLLKAGTDLLEHLKLNPADAAIRKDIARAQQGMEAIQKTLRRSANALQRDTAPSVAMIDRLAESVRRLADADEIDVLKRVTGTFLENVRELYNAQPTLPAKNIVDVKTWEASALAGIDQARDFHEAYARSGFQAMLALETMTLAVSPTPPKTSEEATTAATAAVKKRLEEITSRLVPNP